MSSDQISSPRSQLLRQLLLKHDAILTNFDSTFALQRAEAEERARRALEQRFPDQKISPKHPELQELLLFLDSEFAEKRDALIQRLEANKAEKLMRMDAENKEKQKKFNENLYPENQFDKEEQKYAANNHQSTDDTAAGGEFSLAAASIRSAVGYETRKSDEIRRAKKEEKSLLNGRQSRIMKNVVNLFESSNEDFQSKTRRLRELLLEFETVRLNSPVKPTAENRSRNREKSSERPASAAPIKSTQTRRPRSASSRSKSKSSSTSRSTKSRPASASASSRSSKSSKSKSNKKPKSIKSEPKPAWNDRFVTVPARPSSTPIQRQLVAIQEIKKKTAAHKANKMQAPEVHPHLLNRKSNQKSSISNSEPSSSSASASVTHLHYHPQPAITHYHDPTESRIRQEWNEIITHADDIHSIHEFDKHNKSRVLAAKKEKESGNREKSIENNELLELNENEQLSSAIRLFYHKQKEVEKLEKLLNNPLKYYKKVKNSNNNSKSSNQIERNHLQESLHKISQAHLVKKLGNTQRSSGDISPHHSTVKFSPEKPIAIEPESDSSSAAVVESAAEGDGEMESEEIGVESSSESERGPADAALSDALLWRAVEEAQRANMKQTMKEFQQIVGALETPERVKDDQRISKSERKMRSGNGNEAGGKFSPASI